MPAVAPVMVKVAVVAPLYTPPLETGFHEAPPFVLTCHWYPNGPVPPAATLKVVLLPAQMVALLGCVFTDAAVHPGGGIVAVHTPRPCVPAAMVRSLALYLIISVLTFGKVGLAFHTVLAPFNRSVSHTPVSVAI